MAALPPTVRLERAAPTPGAMTPVYASREDESFRILAGELTFFLGQRTVRAAAGDVVTASGALPRALRVEAPGTRWLVETRTPSAARLDDFGHALARPLPPAAAWASPEDEQTVTAIGEAAGLHVLGPPGALPGAG
ncbi:MAG TPA: hypothetical protein VK915_00060 [Gaiellaceae bacterium]|nr:hypothetical protein [Gaiellaceae bacterium]